MLRVVRPVISAPAVSLPGMLSHFHLLAAHLVPQSRYLFATSPGILGFRKEPVIPPILRWSGMPGPLPRVIRLAVLKQRIAGTIVAV